MDRHQEHKWVSNDRFVIKKLKESTKSPNSNANMKDLDMTITSSRNNLHNTIDMYDLRENITQLSKKYEPYAKLKITSDRSSPKVVPPLLLPVGTGRNMGCDTIDAKRETRENLEVNFQPTSAH